MIFMFSYDFADFYITRDNFKSNFVAATVGDGMSHETIFNATCKIWARVLQVFESLSKACSMLP